MERSAGMQPERDAQRPVRGPRPAKKEPVGLRRLDKTSRVLQRRGLHSKFALFLSSSYLSSNSIPT
jgi:hypothetical protein